MADDKLTPRDDEIGKPRRDESQSEAVNLSAGQEVTKLEEDLKAQGQPEKVNLSIGHETTKREQEGLKAESRPEELNLITGQELAKGAEEDWEDEVTPEESELITRQEITTRKEARKDEEKALELIQNLRSTIVHWAYLPFGFPVIVYQQVVRPVWQFILSPRGLEILLSIIVILGIGRYRSNMNLAKTPPETLFLERQQALFDYRPAPSPANADSSPPPQPSGLASIFVYLTGTNTSSLQKPASHNTPERLELNSANLPSGVLYYTRTTSPYSLLNGGWHRTQLNQMLPWELFFRSLRPNYTSLTAGTEPITPFSSKEQIKSAALSQISQIQNEILYSPGIQILRPASSTPRRVPSEDDYEDLPWVEKITAKLYPFLVKNKLKGPYQKVFKSYEEEEQALEADRRVQDPDNIHYRARDIIDALVLAHAMLVNPAARCQYHLASESPDWYGVPVRGSCGKSERLVNTWQGHLDEHKYDHLEFGADASWFSLDRGWNLVLGLVKRLKKEGVVAEIGSWLGVGPGLETKTVEAYEKVYWWDVWKEQREQQHKRRWRADSPLLEPFVKPSLDEARKYWREGEEDRSWIVRLVPLWLRKRFQSLFRRDRLLENMVLSEERRAWVKVNLFLVLVSGLLVLRDSWFAGRGYSFPRWLGRWLLVGFLWRFV